MQPRLLLFILITLLLPTLCLAAPKKKTSTERRIAPVARVATDGEKRIALVIGNSSYAASPLKNPVNDARDVGSKLRKLGFEVIERSNLTTRQIGGTLREFRSKLEPGAVALVFYAGHGLQIKGENYLPAVDADIHSEEDVSNQSLSVKQIMDLLDDSKSRLNLVFLDACRNNPYARSFRSTSSGLARVSAPSGTLISYATRPGSVAADGSGRNGLYTSKLLAQMDSSQQIEQSLKRVVTEVKAASNGKQEPWMEGSIEGDFCFAGCSAGSQTVGSQTGNNAGDAEKEAWALVKASTDPADLEDFLSKFPGGAFANTAKIKLRQLEKRTAAAGTQVAMAPRPQAPAPRPARSGNFTDPTTGMEFVAVPQGFSIGKYEVTQGQWKKVMGNNPSHFSSCGDICPVEKVSWDDAQVFISRLNSQSGKQHRLPTEAEWEYACRAGENREYCGSNDVNAVAWYDGNSGSQTHPVSQKQANAWGIHDMSGNVWEWVQDIDGSYRILRGGSWDSAPEDVRASIRTSNDPGTRYYNSGFRLVLSAQ